MELGFYFGCAADVMRGRKFSRGEAGVADSISFTVLGVPQPQGSTRAFIPKGWTRPIITAANAKTKPWRQQIAGMALVARGSRETIDEGPVYLRADFYFDRPKSVKSPHKTTKPDLDKLLRSLGDALTGILFADDAQIVECEVTKRFGSPARVEVKVGRFSFGTV
jgi:Holliday junction resolvase RusA-like endonuclease